MPQFAYKKGQLAMASRSVEDLFINRGLQMEYKWALVFNQKPDSRDNRSLVYDGRLITPEVDPNDFVFKNTPIMDGRTEMANMLPGSKMQVIEDVSTDAVPVSLEPDLSTSVKGAQRVAQLGQDAMEKIVAAATHDICMPDRSFMIFVRCILGETPRVELPNVLRHCLWVRGSLRLVAAQQARAPQIQAPCGEATDCWVFCVA